MSEQQVIRNSYGLTFSSVEEMEAWEAYIRKRLERAKQTPRISNEEMRARLARLAKK